MIDEDRTMQLYGYTSDMLKPKSNKPIVKVCDECGEYSIIGKAFYKNLCKSCSRKGQIRKPFTKKHKQKLSEAQKGKKHTKETIEKMSDHRKGKNNSHYGKHHSLETRVKLSCIKQDIKFEDFNGFIGRAPNREYVLSKELCIQLNTKFKGSDFHHIMSCAGIYIPNYLHRSIKHSLKSGKGMAVMNLLAMQFLYGGLGSK